jgi:hypothetical protein
MKPGVYPTNRAAVRHLLILALISAPFWLAIFLLIARPLG